MPNIGDIATVNAPLAGTSGMIKAGQGALILGGSNSFTGAVTITAGNLRLTTDSNLGASFNGIVLSGGTLKTTANFTLAAGHGITGSGGLNTSSGTTLTVNSIVGTSALTFSGGGNVVLTNIDGVSNGASFSNSLGAVTINNPFLLSVPSDTTFGYAGIVQLTGVTMPVGVTGGSTIDSKIYLGAATNAFNIADPAGTLTLSGEIRGAGVIAETGPGTLVLGSDNPLFAGSGGTPASIRQGVSGVSPTTGGIISVGASQALGTGQYQANGGTLLNTSGSALTFTNTISVGAQDAAATPGGLVFQGSPGSSIQFTGDVSLFRSSGTYAHTITFNTPTTFSGNLTATGSSGSALVLAGTSTLTLGGTVANTLAYPITIATTGASAGVVAAKEGAFSATSSLTINAGAILTINTGVAAAINTINDNAVITLNSSGKIFLTLAGSVESVGGLYLPAGGSFMTGAVSMTFGAGYAPAGTYGAVGSGALYQSNSTLAAPASWRTSPPFPNLPRGLKWQLLLDSG